MTTTSTKALAGGLQSCSNLTDSCPLMLGDLKVVLSRNKVQLLNEWVLLPLAHHACGFCNGAVAVLPGNGNGTFMTPLRYTSGGSKADAILVADVNGDRKPDVLVANECLSCTDCSSGSAGVLLGWAVKTNTDLASTLNPSIYGQKTNWMAKVTAFGSAPPTGAVLFRWSRDGQTHEIGSAPLNASGVTTLTRSTLNVPFGGPYPMVANLREKSDPIFYVEEAECCKEDRAIGRVNLKQRREGEMADVAALAGD